MADKQVSIDLIIKSSEAASSLKEVKQSLKDIKDAMISAGEGTPEFLKLARAAGELKDKVDDSNEAINAMNPNKFQAVATFASAAAGGISAVTGAMGLFGEQSEEVTKTLAKVQSAMALSQGLAALSELPKAWNNLKAAMASSAVVQKIVTAGQWLWNAALMANPIGLIIAGVVALTAGVYLLVKAFSSSNVEQERQLKLTKDLNAANVEGAKNAAVERNNLEILYKTSTDQTKSLQERKDAQVELQKTYPLTFKNYTDEEFALGKAKIGFDNLTDSVLSLATMKAKQSVLDKLAMEKEEFIAIRRGEIDQADLDYKNAKWINDKIGANNRKKDAEEEIKAKEKEFDLNSKAIIGEIEGAKTKSKLAENEKIASGTTAKDKTDAAAQAKADAEKGAAEYKARKEEREKLDKEEKENKAKIDEDFRVSQLTAEQKQLEDFAALQKVYLDNKNITQEQYDNRLFMYKSEILDKINTKELKQTELSLIAEMEATNAAIDNAQFEVDEKARIEAEGIEKAKAARQTETTAKLAQAQEVVNKLQRISDLAFSVKFAYMKKGAKDEEAVLRAQFKINKALQLSTAIISGISATINAFNNGMKNPVPLLGPATAAVYAIGAAIMSAGQIAKIAATQFDTSSVSTTVDNAPPPDINASAATATSNSQPSTLLNPDGTVANQNTPTPAPIQVYVVESDITSTQTQVAVVQNQMNFQ